MAGAGAGSEVLHPMATLDCPILASFAGLLFLNNSGFALECKMVEFVLYLSNTD